MFPGRNSIWQTAEDNINVYSSSSSIRLSLYQPLCCNVIFNDRGLICGIAFKMETVKARDSLNDFAMESSNHVLCILVYKSKAGPFMYQIFIKTRFYVKPSQSWWSLWKVN